MAFDEENRIGGEGKSGAGPAEAWPSWAARAKIKGGREGIIKLLSYFLNIFSNPIKLKLNSFVNFNQTQASQINYAAACMHIHVYRPIFNFNFNKVIIFLNLNAHKMHN